MKQLLGILCVLLLSIGLAQEAKFSISSTTETSYTQNTAGAIDIFIKLQEGTDTFSNAVIFLNIVESSPNHPQAAHKIFTSASEEPQVFQAVYPAEAFLAGIGTSLNFQLKQKARLGNYSLVIQIFEGTNTDPHKVGGQTRLAIKAFSFEVIEP